MIIIDGIVFSLQRHGGISVYFRELIRYLSLHQEQASLLLEEPSLQGIVTAGKSVSVLHRPARLLERYRSCRPTEPASVFHSSYYRLPDRRETPSVVTVYDFVYERYIKGPRRWAHSEQKNAAIRAAQSVICISESTRQDFLEFVGEVPGQSVCVIHCGVSEIFRPLGLTPVSSSFVLYVGQRGGYKNFRLVLEAMTFLPDLELHCVGGGAFCPNELKGVSESVVKRVRHLGLVTDEELNALYNRTVCLVYPSSYEGFGIPVVEAMRAGCPVVCTDCKAVIEVGREALTVVSEHDPKLIADAILKTASSERHHLIMKGLSVAQDYSWDVTHRQTLEVYRSLGA